MYFNNVFGLYKSEQYHPFVKFLLSKIVQVCTHGISSNLNERQEHAFFLQANNKMLFFVMYCVDILVAGVSRYFFFKENS